ncbi:VOC family protein [Streptomyces sparsogenes]
MSPRPTPRRPFFIVTTVGGPTRPAPRPAPRPGLPAAAPGAPDWLDLGTPGPDPRAAWTPYFHTPDADATAALVTEAGGTVRAAPFDVFDEGRMAQFTDPGGARFAV